MVYFKLEYSLKIEIMLIKYIIWILSCISPFIIKFNIQTFMITINSLIRTSYPSSYIPPSKSCSSILSHPMLARSVATIAEYYFYLKLGNYLNIKIVPITTLIITGEILCWLGFVLGCTIISFMEDVNWTLLNFLILLELSVNDITQIFKVIPIGMIIFIIYMLLYHLPCSIQRKNILNLNPYKYCSVNNITEFNLKWQFRSLLLLFITFLYINF